MVAGASHDQSLGLGMLCYEDGTWVLTTFGVADAKPPTTFAEMLALADELLPSHFTDALAHAEPVGDPAFHAFPASRWRRYDKLDRFPGGIVPLGDAVASFNPTFGQGMTMTSLQAGHLRRALQSPDAGDLARRAQPGHRQDHLSGVDHERHRRHHFPPRATRRPMPWWWRPSGALFDQFLGAAETEPVLAEWFLRRFSLLDSLYMVPAAAHHRPRHRAQPAAVAKERTKERRAAGPERSQPYGRPEQLGGLGRDQPDGAVVGGHPGGHAALQRERLGLPVHRRRALGAQQDLRAFVTATARRPHGRDARRRA